MKLWLSHITFSKQRVGINVKLWLSHITFSKQRVRINVKLWLSHITFSKQRVRINVPKGPIASRGESVPAFLRKPIDM